MESEYSVLKSKICCNMMSFQQELQGENEDLVGKMISTAYNVISPNSDMENFNKCDPLPYKHSGKHFFNPIHGYDSIPILPAHCDARYYKLESLVDGKIQWMPVIGHGFHTHTDLIQRPTWSSISTVLQDIQRTCSSITVITTVHIRTCLFNSLI